MAHPSPEGQGMNIVIFTAVHRETRIICFYAWEILFSKKNNLFFIKKDILQPACSLVRNVITPV